MTFTLRPYQRDAIEQLKGCLERDLEALLVLPTGTGKTATVMTLLAETLKPGGRVLILVPLRTLLDQTVKVAKEMLPGRTVSALKEGRGNYGADVVVTTQQTMSYTRNGATPHVDRYLKHGAPTVMFVDEAHRHLWERGAGIVEFRGGDLSEVRAHTRGIAFMLAASPKTQILGATATPERADGLGLLLKRNVVQTLQPAQAIQDGWLAPLHVTLNLIDGLRATNKREEDAVLRRIEEDTTFAADVVSGAVSGYMRHLDGKAERTVFVCSTVAQSKQIRAELLERGVVAEHADGSFPPRKRDAILKRLRTGVTEVLTQCSLVCEGFDLPAIDGLVLARPCGSRGLFIQIMGRAMRLSPGKAHAYMLDLCGATVIHEGLGYVAPDASGRKLRADEVAEPDEDVEREEREEQERVREERILAGQAKVDWVDGSRYFDLPKGSAAFALVVNTGHPMIYRLQEGTAVLSSKWGSIQCQGVYHDFGVAKGVANDLARKMGGDPDLSELELSPLERIAIRDKPVAYKGVTDKRGFLVRHAGFRLGRSKTGVVAACQEFVRRRGIL